VGIDLLNERHCQSAAVTNSYRNIKALYIGLLPNGDRYTAAFGYPSGGDEDTTGTAVFGIDASGQVNQYPYNSQGQQENSGDSTILDVPQADDPHGALATASLNDTEKTQVLFYSVNGSVIEMIGVNDIWSIGAILT
jgi:hypothetical protein